MRTYILNGGCVQTAAAAIVLSDAEAFSTLAAEHVSWVLQRSLRERFAATVALAGGSTPRGLYAKLAESSFSRKLDWQRVHIFWGDERLVSPDAEESNYALAANSLLRQIDIPPENIHRMPGESRDPSRAAAEYARTIRGVFTRFGLQRGSGAGGGSAGGEPPPRFDLIILGLGADGHTASLFPGSPALLERERWVLAVDPGSTPPHVQRLTLTLPIINRARHVLFLAAGPAKLDLAAHIFHNSGRASLPAGQVLPEGQLVWLLHDEDGDRQLERP